MKKPRRSPIGFNLIKIWAGAPAAAILAWSAMPLPALSAETQATADPVKAEKILGEISDKGLGVINQDPKVPDLHLDDPRLDPVYEKCADLKIPINLHVGEPIWFYLPMDEKNDGLMNAYHWRLDNKTNLLSHTQIIGVLENVLKRHPRTTVIACHYANCEYDFSILARLLDA